MKKLLEMAVASLGIASLAGCATPVSNYTPVAREISEPPLDSISTAMVGDVLLRQGRYEERDVLQVESAIKVGMLGSYTFLPGHYIKTGDGKKSSFYNESSFSGSGHVQTSAFADPFKTIEMLNDGETICGVTIFNLKVCTKTTHANKTRMPILSANSFQQTLIYSGKVGDKINIGYREFSGDTARPAFNNDVEYDLSDSKVIGYKGASVEIIEATNQHLKYRVIRNFNTATR